MKPQEKLRRRGGLIAAWATTLFTSTSVTAQIPVIDATQIQHHLETIVRLKEQIKQLNLQYKAMTGTRSLGAILNDPAFQHYLPSEWRLIYDDLKTKGYKGLEKEALKIHTLNQHFDSCAVLKSDDQRLICETQVAKPAQDKAFGIQAYDIANQRLEQIEALMKKINDTQDIKSIAELQGRLAAEQANIQNEKIKLAMYELVSKAEERLQNQRMHDIHMRNAAKRGGLNVQPITFTIKH